MIDYLTFASIRYIPEVVQRPPLWRILHESELPEELRHTPPGMPEVRPFFPNHYTPFLDVWQRLSKELNPLLTPEKWTQVYTGALWIANNQGFDMAGDPRNNYVTGVTDKSWKDPRTEVLGCGGDLRTGYEEGENLVVQALNWRAFTPSADWLMDRPWFLTHAVRYGKDGQPKRFPQGEQPDGSVATILHPFMADTERYTKITIPLKFVERWTENFLPDPFTLYR